MLTACECPRAGMKESWRGGGAPIKNHEWADGQLLQTNKKWSQLKERQKAWIYKTAKLEYDQLIAEFGKQPVHGAKKAVIERIYAQITERGIWIPYGEVSRVLSRRIASWRRVATQNGANLESKSDFTHE